MNDFNYFYQKMIDWVITQGPNLILAIITYLIGRWVIARLVYVVEASMQRTNLDVSLRPFLKNLLSVGLNILLIISVASMLGIATTSFVAILGAAGLAVGLALQGSLSNFAGGALILFFKPFKVGDLVDIQGHLGHVKQILIFNTMIVTPDNKTVIIPNAAISNGNITNISREGFLRVDLVVGIAYKENIQKARDVIMRVMQDHPKVMQDPAPSVNVLTLADSAIELAVRPFARVEDYWTVYFEITEGVKIALDANNISIPFPQRDVHLIQTNGTV